MKETKSNWEAIGVLDGIPENRKSRAIKAFDILMNHVITDVKMVEFEQNDKRFWSLMSLSFSVFHRIIRRIDIPDEMMPEIANEFIFGAADGIAEIFNQHGCFHSTIDYEAEYVAKFSDEMTTKIIMQYDREYWKKLGLLNITPENKKDVLVRALNVIFNYLMVVKDVLNDSYYESIPQCQTLPFPMMVRLINNSDAIFTDDIVLIILREFMVELETSPDLFEETLFSIDTEAYFINDFAERKVEELKSMKR